MNANSFDAIDTGYLEDIPIYVVNIQDVRDFPAYRYVDHVRLAEEGIEVRIVAQRTACNVGLEQTPHLTEGIRQSAINLGTNQGERNGPGGTAFAADLCQSIRPETSVNNTERSLNP